MHALGGRMRNHKDRVGGCQTVLFVKDILVGGGILRGRDRSPFPGKRRRKHLIGTGAGRRMVMTMLGRAQARQRVAGVVRIRVPVAVS